MTFLSLRPAIDSRPFWLLPLLGLLAGTLLAWTAYGLLPQAGLSLPASLLTLDRFLLLLFAMAGGLGYLAYLTIILRRPYWLLAWFIVLWPLAEWGNERLLHELGVNIHFRPLVLMAVGAPALILGLRYGWRLLKALPHLRVYGLFFLWLLGYFLFYNAHAMDPRWGLDSVWSEGSVSVVHMTAYLYCLLGLVIGAVAMMRHPSPHRLFDSINKLLLVVSGLMALVTLLGYPSGETSVMLDGFRRAHGLFTHPNPFAHHMGILLLYLLGLYCYYQGPFKARMPRWLLLPGLALNGGAFLLGLSKTALGVFALGAVVLFALTLSSPVIRRRFVTMGLGLLLLVPVGLWVFEAVTGDPFTAMLEARLDEDKSMIWRVEVWDGLWAGINPVTALTGHGFTAANARIFHLTFNDLKNAQPLMMVHNGYLALLYDLGLLGWLLFAAVATALVTGLKRLLRCPTPGARPLAALMVVLSGYFLAVAGVDEMTYMFDAPQLYWTLVSMLLVLIGREPPSALGGPAMARRATVDQDRFLLG